LVAITACRRWPATAVVHLPPLIVPCVSSEALRVRAKRETAVLVELAALGPDTRLPS
jgi:hypothetical protein